MKPNPGSVGARAAFENSVTAPEVLVSRLRMNPDHRGGVAVLVEGSTDVELYRAFMTQQRPPLIVMVAAQSKDHVLNVAEKVHGLEIPVVAIVDSDDELVLGVERERPFIVRTDFRDAEATLFLGYPGDRLVATTLDPEKAAEYEEQYSVSAKSAIMAVAAVSGAARVVNREKKLALRFQQVEVSSFVDRASICVNTAAYVRSLAAASQRNVDPQRLGQQIERVLERHPVEHLVPGHDVIKVLAAVAGGPLGKGVKRDSAALEHSLRTACHDDFFRSTSIHRRLQEMSEALKVPLVA